jgi:hypothetical protein
VATPPWPKARAETSKKNSATEINLRMRIIDFSLALAEREQTAEPTLRQHAEVDTKDNLRAARLPLVLITERGSKTRKKGVMFELPHGSSIEKIV